MLPIVYTPTVAQAIEHYSQEYRRPRGIYLSVDHPELIEASLLAYDVGLGDAAPDRGHDAAPSWASGTGESAASTSPWGKLVVYTAAGGIDPDCPHHPGHTGRGDRPAEPARRPAVYRSRVPPAEYDASHEFVREVGKLFPLAQPEAIGVANARRLLERYRERLTFNDIEDRAVNLAAVLAATRASGAAAASHRIVHVGMAGAAGPTTTAAMVAEGVPSWRPRGGSGPSTADAGHDRAERHPSAPRRDPAEVAGWRRETRYRSRGGGSAPRAPPRRSGPRRGLGRSPRRSSVTWRPRPW